MAGLDPMITLQDIFILIDIHFRKGMDKTPEPNMCGLVGNEQLLCSLTLYVLNSSQEI